MGEPSLIADSPTVRWCARIFLLIVVIGIIYWIWRGSKERQIYDYQGLTGKIPLQVSDTLIDRFFGGAPRKRGWSRRQGQPRVNKTEEQCRAIVQRIYNRPFPSIRPDFLKSPMTKKNLELDCYNADLKIAIEYNGQQHYRYTPHFHKSKRDFYSQVHRDDWKRKRCREMGIRLIEIPYWITEDRLEEYIRRELGKKGCL